MRLGRSALLHGDRENDSLKRADDPGPRHAVHQLASRIDAGRIDLGLPGAQHFDGDSRVAVDTNELRGFEVAAEIDIGRGIARDRDPHVGPIDCCGIGEHLAGRGDVDILDME